MKNRVPIILGILILALCSPKQDQVEKFVEDGVEVVINHLEPYRVGGPGSLMLEELLRIDTENSAIAETGLADISGFAVSSVGEIFILRNFKGDGDFVYKFNHEGIFEKSFGSQGQGPGEILNPFHIAVDGHDQIIIPEPARQIIHKYNREGGLIKVFKMEDGDAVTPSPRDRLLIRTRSLSGGSDTAVHTINLNLLNADLELLEKIDEFSFEVRRDRLRITEPIFCWGVSKTNIYVVNEDRGYEILVHDFDGRIIRKIRKEYSKVPFFENEKNKALQTFPEGMREEIKKIAVFPEHHPPIQNLIAAENGMLLVETFEAGDNPQEYMFDIFNEEGVFIGRTSLQAHLWEGILWAQIKAGRLYCLEEKPSGFKELAVYDMQWKE